MSDILRTFAKNIKHVIDMKKAVFVLVVLVLGVGGLRAQHFEWAKGYSGSDRGTSPDNYIVGAVTDREGNLYILGQCSPNAIYGNQNLNEGAYYHSGTNNTLIAKISPQGEMVWHKIISNDRGTQAFDIRMQGDTEIVCMVDFTITHHLYYLDTMLRTVDNTLMPIDSIAVYWFTAFIWLDLDGNVKEQHFLQEAYIDTAGRVITTNIQTGGQIPTDHAFTSAFPSKSFDIDNEGNIYMVKATNDLAFISCDTCPDGFLHPSIENGLLSGYAVYLDGRRVYDIYPEGRPKSWNPLLIKCSPHFNRLIRWQNVFENETGSLNICNNVELKIDSDNNLYFIMSGKKTNHLVTGSITRNNLLSFYATHQTDGICIKYDSLFIPVFAKQFEFLGDSSINTSLSAKIRAIAFDDIDSTIFILAVVATNTLTSNNMCNIVMDRDTIDDIRNCSVVWLRFRQNGALLSFGKTPSFTETADAIFNSRYDFVANNNRVVVQIRYYGNISWELDSIEAPMNSQGVGLFMWDYEGHPFHFENYNVSSPQNTHPTSTYLSDSSLYLIGSMNGEASFGENILRNSGSSQAFIVRYVDAAFMTPYVYTGDTGNVRIVVAEAGTWVSYPNPFRQRVTIESDGQAVRTAWLTDLTGRREEVRLQAAGTGRYVLDLTGRPQATYLLTLVTADGQERTLRLLKQQDMFGE